MLNSSKQGRKEENFVFILVFLEPKLLAFYFKATFHLEVYLKVKEKYTYKNPPNEIALFFFPKKTPVISFNDKLIYMDLLFYGEGK